MIVMPGARPFEEHAEEYDRWFDENERVYLAELDAVRAMIPEKGISLEVGAGTGRFAAPLGIRFGLEPSRSMASIARGRGVAMVEGVAESLPFLEASFDTVLMITAVCFLEDMTAAFDEAYRVLRRDGVLVAGILDRDTEGGRAHERGSAGSRFFGAARLRSAREVICEMARRGFHELRSVQTLCGSSREAAGDTVERGYGRGFFAVLRGRKQHSEGGGIEG